jgi:hypothetical protein
MTTALRPRITDLRGFLPGRWRIARIIEDRRLGLTGSFRGRGVFTPEGMVLRYEEMGELRLGDHRGPAQQSYDFVFRDDGQAEVRFRDGRFFHDLDLSAGHAEVVHLCGADTYRGQFEAVNDRSWRSYWRVSGPRKDQLIASQYRRDPRS